jgi:hypothetical protein
MTKDMDLDRWYGLTAPNILDNGKEEFSMVLAKWVFQMGHRKKDNSWTTFTRVKKNFLFNQWTHLVGQDQSKRAEVEVEEVH